MDNEQELKLFEISPRQKTAALFAVIAICFNIAAVVYVLCGSWIYTGEYAEAWDKAMDVVKSINEGNFLQTFVSSVLHSDISFIPVLIPGLLMYIFGSYRIVFVVSIVNLYLLPLAGAVFAMARRGESSYRAVTALTLLAYPVLIKSAVDGYIQLGAAAACLWVCIIEFPPPPEAVVTLKKKKPKYVTFHAGRAIASGLLLVLAGLFDYMYFYFAAAFMIAKLAEGLFYGGNLKNTGLTFAVWAAGISLLRGNWFSEKMTSDFVGMFSGYSPEPYNIISAVGLAVLLYNIAASLYFGITNRDRRYLTLWIGTVILYIMISLADTGQEKRILYIIPFLITLTVINLSYMLKSISESPTRKALAAFSGVIIAMSSIVPYSSADGIDFGVYPQFSLRPRQNENEETILAIKKYLNKTVEEGATVGVLANSDILNEELLTHAEWSLGSPNTREDYFIKMPYDGTGDMTRLYTADYMVAAFPFQGGAGDTALETVIDSYTAYADIAIPYVEVGEEFNIGDVAVKLYKRSRPATEQEINEFRFRYQEAKR